MNPLRNTSTPSLVERSCPACGLSFVADSRRRWCSAACRQRGFRLRRTAPDEAPIVFPRRLPMSVIVYQCSQCEARYLGEQRCPTCGTFCHRLGPGAECPHCNEPVAISDITPSGVGRR